MIFPIGAVFGSLVGAASCRNFGRRMTMIYCDLIATSSMFIKDPETCKKTAMDP